MLGDDDRKLDPRMRRLHDSVGCGHSRDEYDACGSTMLLPGLPNRVIDRDAVDFLPALAGRCPGDDTPAADLARVVVHQLGVEPALPAGDVLNYHTEVSVSVDHGATSIAARTAASMLSSIR